MTASHGFELIKEQFIEELNSQARLYRHAKTGAQLLSIENDDENKTFGVTFRTPPEDSTGVPHIMEHSVLGGSRKYRVKEPFVELVKGSFKTFLNAMTASDWTTYPVASTNLQDFRNLVDVYLDAVFHPLIEPHHLEQEGWHYEIEQPDAPLTYKGVVFNEMKGAYSSPDNVLYRYSQRSLFPQNVYQHDSGGDPREIPNLTYEQFRSFHETYYHPSNAFIFFYGDDDPQQRLAQVGAYLDGFEAAEIETAVDVHPPFDAPQRLTVPYSVDEEEGSGKKAYVRVNWALPEQTDPQMWMALGVLSYVLMGTPASPLRKALIDSGLGEDVTGGGFSMQLRQPTFGAGLKGVEPDNVDQVEALILDTLAGLADAGFDPELVEAAVNTIEFNLRENNTGSYPRGLALMFRALSTWLYEQDPLTPLMFAAPLQAVKEKLSTDTSYLQTLVRNFLLNNTHRATVVLEPDSTLQQQLEAEEKARLAAVRDRLNDTQIQQLIERTHELKRIQSAPDDPAELAKIPRLTLEDLDPEVTTVPIEVQTHDGATILYHDLFTNGIVYLDVALNVHALPPDLLPYINLFGRALTEIGTETEDFVKLSQRIGRKTGGVYATTSISNKFNGPDADARLVVRAKATMAQTADMLDLLRDILLTVKLDNRERFRQMALEAKARREAGLIPGGHQVVNARLGSLFSEGGWASEQTGGVSYLFFLRRLAQQIETDWPAVLARLEQIRDVLVSRQGLICNVTLDAENWQAFAPQLQAFIETLPDKPVRLAEWDWGQTAVSEGLTIPAQVNYVGKGANLYDLGYERHGSISVINNYLRTSYLWEKIRVQGGAYGAFVNFGSHSGRFSYLSYRDPNLMNTLHVYDQTPDFLRRPISSDELTKSIIGAISAMDSYQLPDAKGYSSMIRFLTGVTDSYRQQVRDEILGTVPADFARLAHVLDAVKDAGVVVVLGSAEAIKAANAQHGDWLQVTKVM